jgi:hypothetical protein
LRYWIISYSEMEEKAVGRMCTYVDMKKTRLRTETGI